MSVVAVIVGAGSGRRFGGDKVFAELAGRPVLAHAVAAFEESPEVDGIVLVLREEKVGRAWALAAEYGWTKLRAVTVGGARRQDSVLAGVRAAQAEWVLIHDAARPLVTPEVVARGLEAARATGAAIAALPVRDTLKRVENDQIIATVDRARLWAAQTPQIFRSALLERALETESDVTDDAAAVEALGVPVRVFLGSERNFKVTTAADLALAEAILRCG
ncbi:MAG: 2-C-methyl-D-erythritol 4-phosphate cytidylyltransferase [Chloroflexota bacterium]|nr:2-C-methyl-D-erythritol 4-phosphate cytidylyltransferase [Dehalococcoidia bacterium]MDW8255096.1 2-C-methyl-D-erythritol 4-phosphate cytidylyltransferase [Chloroflexota bacterium]